MAKQKRRPDDWQEDQRYSLDAGDFRADGSWNPSADAVHRGPRFRFVQQLIRARRAAHLFPTQVVEQIEASQFAGMFGELAQWKQITRWDDWPFAATRTVADDCVKRNGIGVSKDPHWEGGIMATGDDEREFVNADREHVASFVANITDRLSLHRPAWAGPPPQPDKPRLSDQEFFEGNAT